MDARRRSWFKLSVDYTFSKTGTKLQEELGPAALGVWAALLAAAKRSELEGTFVWTSDEGAWQQLGILEPERLGFTLDEFLKITGRLKQTRRRRRGRVMYAEITQWEHWQQGRRRRKTEPKETPETRAGHPRTTRSEGIIVQQKGRSETEKETETHTETENTQLARKRPRDELWDALVACFGDPETSSARGSYNRARKELAEAGATPEQVLARAAEYRRRWPNVAATPSALVKHWHTMAGVQPKNTYEQRMMQIAAAAEKEAQR